MASIQHNSIANETVHTSEESDYVMLASLQNLLQLSSRLLSCITQGQRMDATDDERVKYRSTDNPVCSFP